MATLPGTATIYIVKPNGLPYAECFRDTANTVAWAMRQLGWSVQVTNDGPRPGTLNIYMAWHWLDTLPLPCSIIYNTEYLCRRWPPGDLHLAQRLTSLAAHCRIWDFSAANVAHLATLGAASALLPIGYAPALTRVPADIEQDIDVLFIGGISPRRQEVLDLLAEEGLHVVTGWQVWGKEKDALIARAKLVLNMHYWPWSALEEERIIPCLANHKAVLAEINPRTSFMPDMQAAVCSGLRDELPGKARYLIDHPAARIAYEQIGYQIATQRDILPYLHDALQGA